MKGSDFIDLLQDSEISSSTVSAETIKEDDKIQLIANRIYINGKLEGYCHKE